MRRFFRLVRKQIEVQLRVRTFDLFSLGLLIIQPAIFSIVGMILSRAAGIAVPNLVYTVIGGGILGMWSGLLFTSTFDILRDRRDGMLELIVGSPTSLGKVEAIRTVANVLAGTLSMVVALAAALFIFKYPLGQANLWGAVISFLLVLVGLWSMGIFLANFLAWTRLSGTMVNFLEAPVAVVCGFMYPISILPQWMQSISMIFPIRWALEAMNHSLLGSFAQPDLFRLWGISIAISLIFYAMSAWLERRVHDSIRITGELNSI
jgi:ABC-2 type transport system permease protein